MSDDRHLGEAAQDLLDGRLDTAARAEAEAHLAGCAECAREVAALRSVKDAARLVAGSTQVPAPLTTAVSAALAREGAAPRPAPRRWALPAAAAALLVLVALAVLVWRSRDPSGLPAAVARAHSDYEADRIVLDLRTADPAALERHFATHGIPFPTHVYDLGMMGYRLVGGRVHALDGRNSALFVYEGPEGSALLCDMYVGRLAELPPPDQTREHDGIRFDVHRVDGTTMVFWEEGDVVCVLVSDIAAEDIIQVAFAKAMKPPGTGT